MQSKFSLSLVAKTSNDGSDPRKSKVPRVSDLMATPETCRNHPVEPSPEVVAKLGSQSLAVGVDIETADWTAQKHGLQRGQFGFFTMCGPEVFEQRIVQYFAPAKAEIQIGLMQEASSKCLHMQKPTNAHRFADL